MTIDQPQKISTNLEELTQSNSATTMNMNDLNKPCHPEWGVMREQAFHPLAFKHQRDLETHWEKGEVIPDFYFWQASLGGYCMADMTQNVVLSTEGTFVLVRRIVDGAAHPGRRKKKGGMG
ncbi:hypothetical protein INT43_004002 [Umbelopsis isabellina]|uniref:Uncharacterized protein n=1 Tax=Mortierella isabellina TaxID=91625 RepID=A0A8H7PU16_MORIS|nr:hypothetical protein INT43_004002 [Umbelopsis isabellina]